MLHCRDTNQYIDQQYVDQYIDIANININIENLIDLYPCNGAKLDQFDDKRIRCDDGEPNFDPKDTEEKQNESLYENDLDISDDSDW